MHIDHFLFSKRSYFWYSSNLESSSPVKQIETGNLTQLIQISSSVDNVSVTRYDVPSPNRLGIDIEYSRNNQSPGIKV